MNIMKREKSHAIQVFYTLAWSGCALITGILGLRSLFVHYAVDCSTYIELTERVPTNALPLAACMLALIVLELLCARLLMRFINDRPRRLAATIASIAILELALGLIWVSFNHYSPLHDQRNVYELAASLYNGKQVSQENIDYVNKYPHQTDMVMMFVGLFSIFHTSSHMLCFYLNTCASALWLVALCVLTFDLTDDIFTTLVCALLSLTFMPLVLYTAYFYGTLISPMLVTWSFVGVQRFIKREQVRWLLLPVLLLVPANLFYRGSLIATIAVLMALVCFAVSRRGQTKLLVASLAAGVLTMALGYASGKVVDESFSEMSGIETSGEGLPTSAWIAMGVAANGEVGEGGWNGLSDVLYLKHDGDCVAIDQEAKRIIRTALNDYYTGKRPLGFFVRKTTRQWVDPTFGSITMTVDSHREQMDGAFRRFREGPTLPIIQHAMLFLMPAIYLCATISALRMARSKRQEQLVTVALFLLGGFVFQLIWEQKSRYCLPYYVCLIPLAAWGMVMLQQSLVGVVRRHRSTNVCDE